MSVKSNILTTILTNEVYKLSRYPFPTITWKDIVAKDLEAQVVSVYKDLGGLNDRIHVPRLNYHIELEDVIIMLDEEKSFNRYRAITLRSAVYEQLSLFAVDKYRSYCRTFESECLKSASHKTEWSDQKSEKEFGLAGENGELHKEGSPVWKQRAFHDFLIDLTPLILPMKIIRISIWDNLLFNNKMYKVNDILITSNPDLRKALLKNLERRIGSVEKI